MFPLGTVLVPTAVLPLHVFEPRYRALMLDLTGGGDGPPLLDPEFGVTLIERGSEVGGGDARAEVGTVARLLDAEQLPDGRWVLAAVGTTRFRVVEWLPDDPYPVALVDDVAEPPWHDADTPRLRDAEGALRRALGLAAELDDDDAERTFTLAADPTVAAWQCAALAPIGPYDRQQLLAAPDVATRLDMLVERTDEVAEVLALRLSGG
ncbi:MAG TPA: LON peptidase substrate-binding domain-containing protein [Acidimicrobiales bacterium]|nr:LON peptidase substrate-binding domain-containing protein [Acidimicrobiales bacterium]